MITPRRTRLVRVPDLHALRRAVASLAADTTNDLFPSAAIVVPTRGAARQLQRAFQGAAPELVTRDELYDSFHARLASPPRRLAPWDREVMLHAAADEAVAAGVVPPKLIVETHHLGEKTWTHVKRRHHACGDGLRTRRVQRDFALARRQPPRLDREPGLETVVEFVSCHQFRCGPAQQTAKLMGRPARRHDDGRGRKQIRRGARRENGDRAS